MKSSGPPAPAPAPSPRCALDGLRRHLVAARCRCACRSGPSAPACCARARPRAPRCGRRACHRAAPGAATQLVHARRAHAGGVFQHRAHQQPVADGGGLPAARDDAAVDGAAARLLVQVEGLGIVLPGEREDLLARHLVRPELVHLAHLEVLEVAHGLCLRMCPRREHAPIRAPGPGGFRARRLLRQTPSHPPRGDAARTRSHRRMRLNWSLRAQSGSPHLLPGSPWAVL